MSAKGSSEELRELGNEAFKKGQVDDALNFYLQALHADPTSPLPFLNSAVCHLKMQNWEQVTEMCNEALSRDGTLLKAYYRRGLARMQLGELRMAITDLKMASKDGDMEAKKKLLECQKAYRAEIFMQAIRKSTLELTLASIQAIEVDSTYAGPKIDDQVGVSPDFCRALMHYFSQTESRPLLPLRYVLQILYEVLQVFKKQATLVRIEKLSCLTVCGDTHGQYQDVMTIFELNGVPSQDTVYCFNGDIVDRGPMSIELFLVLCAWKIALPSSFYINRGNHEDPSVNRFHGLFKELEMKYSDKASDLHSLFGQVMQWMPLAHLYQDNLILHGGIPRPDLTLSEIESIERGTSQKPGSLSSQILWSDPNHKSGINPSHRGEGVLFGPDITSSFLKLNGLKRLIRSHVWEPTGWKEEHNGQCITIFSAPNYIPGNPSPAAYMHILPDDTVEFCQFNQK